MSARFSTTLRPATTTGVHGGATQVQHGPAAPAGLETVDAHTLARWGFEVDLDGIAAHENHAQYLVKAASASGVRPVLVQVLADTAEPAVARTRAFGKLALALAS